MVTYKEHLRAAIVRARPGPGATVQPGAGLGASWHSVMELLAGRKNLAYNQTPSSL